MLLRDALRVLLVLATADPDRYQPAAARFGARLVAERRLLVAEAQLAFAALQTLAGSDPLPCGEALCLLLERHGEQDAASYLEEWLTARGGVVAPETAGARQLCGNSACARHIGARPHTCGDEIPVREDLPRFIKPMLASSGALPDGQDWAFEVKWDGARAQVRCDGSTLSMRTRSGRSCGEEFPELQALLDPLRGRRVVLDAELVCLGPDGMPDFAALRSRLGSGGRRSRTAAHQRKLATLVIFDVLHCAGLAIRHLPYLQRREILAELDLGEGPGWRTPRHFCGAEGGGLVAATREHRVEGVVAKRLTAPYSEGRRSSAWVKHKHRRSEWFVVTGWRERADELPEFMLARRHAGRLVPAGSASLGLDGESRAMLLSVLAEHELPRRRRRGVRWAAPLIEVSADFHGRVDGPVRDAVLREVSLPGT